MKPVNLIVGAFLSLLAFVVVLMTYFTVNQNEVAVVTSFGKIAYVADPGLHFKTPFVNNTTFYSTAVEDVSSGAPIRAYTVDNQEVDVTYNIFYQIDPKNAACVYETAPNYEARLTTTAIDRVKTAIGKVNVSAVFGARAELRNAIHTTLKADAAGLCLSITDFQLTSLDPTESYRQAIAAAATAKAGIETKQYQQEQARKDAETIVVQTEGTANAQRAQAKGQADATLYQAQAEAQSIALKGDATAKAIKAQADALSANPHLVDLHKADKWDGVLPTAVYASAPIPFLSVDAPAAKGQ